MIKNTFLKFKAHNHNAHKTKTSRQPITRWYGRFCFCYACDTHRDKYGCKMFYLCISSVVIFFRNLCRRDGRSNCHRPQQIRRPFHCPFGRPLGRLYQRNIRRRSRRSTPCRPSLSCPRESPPKGNPQWRFEWRGEEVLHRIPTQIPRRPAYQPPCR